MGPASPLYCEYLPPWVLRKEVQTILSNDGIEALCSPSFRTSSQSSAVIFWNLIQVFRYRWMDGWAGIKSDLTNCMYVSMFFVCMFIEQKWSVSHNCNFTCMYMQYAYDV